MTHNGLVKVGIGSLRLPMISIEELKRIDPKLQGKSDKEILEIRNLLYGLAKLSLETYFEEKSGSKLPVRVYGLNKDDM